MKVLIAINNDAISEAIGNYYENNYAGHLEMKNVYYFKALLEEIKLTSYERIVIHEELESFSTTNQEVIDNNLFETIDRISDEGNGATIIFICSERRKRDDKLARKLFNIGIYNVLLGEDRTIEEVSKLLSIPRTKKEAKSYIDYDLEEDAYKREEEVNEAELNRILMAYENAVGEEQRYVDIFDRIMEQYTDMQLKVICSFLPEQVKGVLSRKSEKFRKIMAISVSASDLDVQGSSGKINFIEQQKNESQSRKLEYEQPAPQKEDVHQQIQKQLEVPSQNYAIKQPDRLLKVPTAGNVPAQIHKVTEVIEKETIREVYETPKDYRKVICFVGAHKAGTTFTINSLAAYLTKRGIKTAIIDATKNKDSYFVYAVNNELNREVAAKSLSLLAKGKDAPVEINRISIYTAIPGQVNKESVDYMKMVEIAKDRHSVVLVDCDFETPLDFFKICQNIYVVQDMDILNLQPVTSFLRELKYRGVNLEKAKIIINKHIKCALPAKRVIEGVSYYSNPEMTIYDELFEKSINYYILPFNEHNYKKYMEGLYMSKVNYAEFTEDFKEALEDLASSIYPIGPSKSKVKDFKNIFSSIKNMILTKKKSEDSNSDFNKITM